MTMKEAADLTRTWVLVLMLVVSCLAFALRAHRLEDKNIWWDEGSSAWQATQDLATITIYQARDQHPPLYYWTLHLWSRAGGHSTFALRFLSTAFGTLCIPLAYALGRSVAGQPIGLLAALFVAMARFHVWWSQELKMYAMVSFLSMASTYLLVLILRQVGVLYPPLPKPSAGNRSAVGSSVVRAGPFLWLIYTAVTALALYAHYLALPIVVSQNLFLFIVLVARVQDRGRRRALFVRWSLSQLTLAALFAFWFLLHQQHSTSWSPAAVLDFSFFLRLVATLLSLGTSTHLERYTWVVLALWLPLLVGLISLMRLKEKRWGGLLLWLCLLAPPALIYLLSLPRQSFLYEAKIAPRFFLVSLIPFSILLAWSLVLIGRRFIWGGLLGVALVLVSSTIALGDYFDSRYLRDDYQTLTRTIQAYARPGEAVLLDTDAEWPIFEYYYAGSLPRHDIPAGEEITPEKARGRLEAVWAHYDGLWVVFTPDALVRDPGHSIENWLAQRGQVVLDEHFGDKRLVLYVKSPRRLSVVSWDHFAIQHSFAVQVDEGVRLVGYDQAVREVRTGDTLRLVTYWQLAGVDLSASGLQVEAALVDGTGIQVSQAASAWGEDSTWPVDDEGAILRVQYDLDISSTIPDGTYAVCLVVSRNSSNFLEPRPCLSTLRVSRTAATSPIETEAIQYPAAADLGGVIRFLGYDMPARSYQPGQTVELTLYWQAIQKVDVSYVVFVHLLGSEFNAATGNFLWGQVDRVPVAGAYPTTAWAVGETVADAYQIPVQPDAPAGVYQIEIGLYEPVTGQRLPILAEDGQRVGDRVLLHGIDVSR
ncbi:MAG: glycosyltransferase family 39 protein [Anaerolineae bacterium]